MRKNYWTVVSEHNKDISTSSNQTIAKTMYSMLPSFATEKRKLDEGGFREMTSRGSPPSDRRASTSDSLALTVGGCQSYNSWRDRGGRGGMSGVRRGEIPKVLENLRIFRTRGHHLV